MRYVFFFLSLNIISGNILPVKGQCTLSACPDISAGSHDCSIEAQEEYYRNDKIMAGVLGALFFNMERIDERFQYTDEADCPDGFDYMPEINQCLYLNLTLMTWDDARNACASFKTGAQMVAIKDSAKQEAVRKYLQGQFTKQESAVCISSHWTDGGKKTWMVGQTRNPTLCGDPYFWKPVGAAETPFSYTNWPLEIPNCYGGHQNCAIIFPGPQDHYRWEDIECDALLCSLCEF